MSFCHHILIFSENPQPNELQLGRKHLWNFLSKRVIFLLTEEKIFLEINQSETTIACGGHVCLTDRDKMSNLYREPTIDASYQVSIHLAFIVFSSPCQRQCELLPSLGVRRPLIFHILIFSSETPQPNELKLGRKHL
jgi:hypothetical protein